MSILRVDLTWNDPYGYGYCLQVCHKLSEFAESTKLKLLAEAFPNTMLKTHTLHAINRDNYQQLILCEKCNSTYEYSDYLNATNATFSSDFQDTLKHACTHHVVLFC